ncbi:serine O-acetyltransferase [Rasiella sp. SM2506]|uniref:serine O-acetyltransferase n=1 Tax=Rasiella sp. SM2506 TaxID=3423914 RepID=UPI003D7AEA36
MIQSYKDYKEYLRADLKSQNKKLGFKTFFFDVLVRFTFLLRFNEYLLNNNNPMIIRFFCLLWYKRLSIKLGFSIPFNVFDQGFAPVHYGLLLVHPRCKIGKNCRVHTGVTIGGYSGFANTFKEGELRPTVIGNNCYIGPGAKLFGGITIGPNCVIGANSVISKSFKNNGVTIAGIPAKIIAEKGSERFLIRGAKID